MPNTAKITSLSKENLVKILIKSGSREASLETIEKDIQAGAPVNADGTMSLLEYCAWLLLQKERNKTL